jgi:hypothetical protein
MDRFSTVVRSSFFFLDDVGNGFRDFSYYFLYLFFLLKSYVKGMVDETLTGGPETEISKACSDKVYLT